MAEANSEPSMEDILSSIKKIISEDSEKTLSSPRPRRTPVDLTGYGRADPASAPAVSEADRANDVLELTDHDAHAETVSVRMPPPPAAVSPAPVVPAIAAPETDVAAAPATLVSPTAEVASRTAFASLATAATRPVAPAAPDGSTTIEGLARDLLRPMLQQWLDAHLPAIVERLVAEEVSRLSGRA